MARKGKVFADRYHSLGSDARPRRAGPAPIAPAPTGLLSIGWRLRGGGPIAPGESPATA